MLVIIEPPDSLAARRLQLEHPLHLPTRLNVFLEDTGNERLLVILVEDAQAAETGEVGEEGQFVA